MCDTQLYPSTFACQWGIRTRLHSAGRKHNSAQPLPPSPLLVAQPVLQPDVAAGVPLISDIHLPPLSPASSRHSPFPTVAAKQLASI